MPRIDLTRVAVLGCLLACSALALLAAETLPAPATQSAYVPIDSWIYSALDRLAALGLIPSQISGLRPWTRAECYRQAVEARSRNESERIIHADAMIAALLRELDASGRGASISLDSVTLRSGFVAGPVLNDSFHLGQTRWNDFGRPYGRGLDGYAAVTVHGGAGRFFFGLRSEYQRAPGTVVHPDSTGRLLAAIDGVPADDTAAFRPPVSRVRPVEIYAGANLANLAISVGRQSQWWGPTLDAPLSFSNNSEPASELRVSTVHPVQLPRVGNLALQLRAEYVIGKLGGHRYTSEPWFNAQKLSLKLTENLELGFTRWSIFWGVGHPITAGSFLRNLTSLTSRTAQSSSDANDPGDRKAGFDFRYRLPLVRRWVTLYSDSYSDDDPSPLAAPRRAAISPGLLVSHIPRLPKLEFRAEAASTTPLAGDYGGRFMYYNVQYRSGNTNNGVLLGNSVGRDGRAVQGWLTYWLDARRSAQAGFRQRKIGCAYLPGGGTQTDATLKGTLRVYENTYAEIMFAYERFWIPLLGEQRRNVTGWVRLSWEPRLRFPQ